MRLWDRPTPSQVAELRHYGIPAPSTFKDARDVLELIHGPANPLIGHTKKERAAFYYALYETWFREIVRLTVPGPLFRRVAVVEEIRRVTSWDPGDRSPEPWEFEAVVEVVTGRNSGKVYRIPFHFLTFPIKAKVN